MRLETWRGQDPNTAPNAHPALPTPPAQRRTSQHSALTHPELDRDPQSHSGHSLLNAWHRTTLAASSQGSCLKGVGLTRGEQQ